MYNKLLDYFKDDSKLEVGRSLQQKHAVPEFSMSILSELKLALKNPPPSAPSLTPIGDN